MSFRGAKRRGNLLFRLRRVHRYRRLPRRRLGAAPRNDILLSVEGSVLNRYEKISIDAEEAGAKASTVGYSGRLNFDYNGFFLKGEYVDLGKKLVAMQMKRGNAQLVELGYNGRGLGVTLTGRRLEWMGQKISSRSLSNACGLRMILFIPLMIEFNAIMV